MKHLLLSSLLLAGLLTVPVASEAKVGDLLPVPKEVKTTGATAFAQGRPVADKGILIVDDKKVIY